MINAEIKVFLEKKRIYAKSPKEKSLITRFNRDFRIAKGEKFGCIGVEYVVLHHVIAPKEMYVLGKENPFGLELINICHGKNEYILVFKRVSNI